MVLHDAAAKHEELGLPGPLLLADDGGQGSRCAHWDDDSFPFPGWSELMTPFFDQTKEQLVTAVTVAALEDLSHEVNYTAANYIPQQMEECSGVA